MCLFMCGYMYECMCPRRSSPLESKVAGCCGPPDMGAGIHI